MTAVTIRPTFKKDSRPDNGLEAVGDEMQSNRTKVFRVVGLVKYAGASVSEDGEITPAARFLSLEVVGEADADEHERMLDGRRKERGLGIAKDIPAAGQIEGQGQFEFGDPADPGDDDEPVLSRAGIIRLGKDGERKVPPASGEEILAERAEAAKGSVIDATAKLAAKDKAGKNAPAASFSGGEA